MMLKRHDATFQMAQISNAEVFYICYYYIRFIYFFTYLSRSMAWEVQIFSYTTCCWFSFPKAPPRITVAQPGESPEAAQAQSAPPREDKFDLLEA